MIIGMSYPFEQDLRPSLWDCVQSTMRLPDGFRSRLNYEIEGIGEFIFTRGKSGDGYGRIFRRWKRIPCWRFSETERTYLGALTRKQFYQLLRIAETI